VQGLQGPSNDLQRPFSIEEVFRIIRLLRCSGVSGFRIKRIPFIVGDRADLS
jgi:hypothetical protein